MKLKPYIVSVPFGEWWSFPGATSTLGTYTLERRGGMWHRAVRVAKTLRYSRRLGGWVNKLGLPNLGVSAVPLDCSDRIVSVRGYDAGDWSRIAEFLVAERPSARCVELNLSCPNDGRLSEVRDLERALDVFRGSGVAVIAKLAPLRWMPVASALWSLGVTGFHLCNTLPCPGGGLSGPVQRQFALWAVEEVRQALPDALIVGGGGVDGPATAALYRLKGADCVAVGSALLNPFNRAVRRVLCD